MAKYPRSRALDRIRLLSRQMSRVEDELFPCEDANPCEICQRITREGLSSGFTHRNFAGLVTSSSRGCNLCKLLKLACLQTQGRDFEVSEGSIRDTDQLILERIEAEGHLDIPIHLRCARSYFSEHILSEVIHLTWKPTDGLAIIGLYGDSGLLLSIPSQLTY
jgi:hypothetical protein